MLERDDWACQVCGDCETTLNIHHKYYVKDKNHWEYPIDAFLTLCEECHRTEYEDMANMEKELLLTLRKRGFLSGDLISLLAGFHHLEFYLPPSVIADVICFALSSPKIMKFLGDEYFKTLEESRLKKNG